MEKNTMDRFIGKYCKIVTKESGEERAHVVIGTVKDVDHNDGFLLIIVNLKSNSTLIISKYE